MSSTSVTPQIEGLPPGAILKPVQPDIQGLPPGAILRPIGATAAPESRNPYQQAADKIPGGTGTSMSAGTQTFDQAHPKPEAGAVQRFAQGAGIPTSQSETTEAVRGMLNPQADPNETDPLLRKEEQIPVLGGDFRARAALAKRAQNETGAVSVAHKVAALVPLVGPAVAAAQDEYDKGNYAGAAGAGLNALLSMEGARSGFGPKTPELPVKSLSAETTEAAARPPVNPVTPAPGVATRSLSTILGGGEKAMAKRPLKGATAAGSASNTEVAQYAKDNGIDLLPGQATGAKGLQTVQAVGERTIVAPGDLPEHLDQQKAAFGNLVDDFKQRVGTEAIPNTEAAGTSLKSQAQHGLDSLKQSAQQDYQEFQDHAGDIPVDLSDVKAKAAATLASQAEALKNVPAQYANPVRNVLKKLSDLQAGPEADPATMKSFNDAVESYGLNQEQQVALRTKLGLPDDAGKPAVKMSTAQQLRSAYLDISRDYTGNVPKSVQRYAAQAAKDIDAAMTKAADQAGATDQWRQANAKWKQLQQTYNNPEHPLYKVLQEADPSKVPSRLLGKGSYGGSPQTVRQLQQSGIDISPLKREVAQQIADRNFALTNGGRGLAGYSTEFLKTLFNPAEFDELTKMGRVGRAIKFEMNPSGTSNVMEGHRQIHGIISRSAGAVVGPIASRLTTSKALARASMGDLTAQPRSLVDILGNRGPEPPPETPPAGAAPVTPPSGPGAPPAPEVTPAAAAPRSIADILSSRPKVPVSDKIGGAKILAGDVPLKGPVSPVAADITRLKAELKAASDPKEIADIQQALEHAQARLEGRPYTPPEQAVVENLPASQPREIDPGTYNRETKVHTPGKTQSVNSAVHDVLAELPNAEHKPTTPQQPMEAGKTVAGNYGNDTAVKTTTGSLPAKYKVVEADSLIPSHNAQTFAKNPQYPEGVQERDYARSKEAQNRVIQQAQNYDPAYTVNTNPDAVNGPPVVTKDGIVLGGNSRTMSTQRLYKAGAGDAYKNSLRLNASQFGVTPAAIDSMKNPVLVREVETPANIEQARRIGADLNKNMTGAMGVGEKAVSAGRSVKPQTLATISGMVNDMGEGATLRDVMRHNGKDIVSMMVKDGVISDRERPQFIDTSTGGLNDEGKSFVERALMGSVVDDPRLMDRVPKSVLGKLEGSLGDLASIGARSDEYNLMPLVREALQEHAEMAMRGLDVNKYLAQGSMFGQAGNPAVEAMTRALAEKPKAFREALSQYAQDAKFDSQGQGLLGIMGKKPSAVQAFNDAFGTKLTEEQFHDALLKSANKGSTIESNGHPDQAAGSNESVRGTSARNASPGSAGKTSAAQAGGKTADQPQAVAQRSLSDILSGKPQEKIDLNAPKSKRKIPPDAAAKADYSGQTVQSQQPKRQNMAQYLAERGLSDSIDHSILSPSGHVSGRAREAALVRSKEMLDKALQAKFDYRDAVNRGEIVDPSGQVVPEPIKVDTTQYDNLIRRANQLEQLANGGMKPRAYRAEAAKLRTQAEAIRPTDINELHARGILPPDVTAKSSLSGQTVPAKAPTFFSKAEQVAEEKLPNSVKADQVISTLQNAGVKADEMKWLGLDDYLKGKDKVSKADLLEHIGENNLQVKEVMKGGTKPMLGTGKPFAGDATKFSNYQLPGGENYRELLLTLPAEGEQFNPAKVQIKRHLQSVTQGQTSIWYDGKKIIQYSDDPTLRPNGQYEQRPDKHWMEVARNLYEKGDRINKVKPQSQGFRGGHFDEPNVLAHVRFNDRISPDGKKTLFLEELQSDWHQKGRKQGYGSDTSAIQAKQDAFEREMVAKYGTEAWRPKALPLERDYWDEMSQKIRDGEGGVPDAPFKATWHELAMKRMLRYAAENGYDQLAWTTGAQQVERYPEALRQVVDKISWKPWDESGLDPELKNVDVRATKGDNTVFSGTVRKSDGYIMHANPRDAIGKNLSEVIGKTMAERAIKEPAGEIGGKDFTVGGEGMKGFYDKILPDFMNKYGKKWGAKVGETQIPAGTSDKRVLDTILREDFGTEWGRATPEQRQKAMDIQDGKAKPVTVPVHSIPITPTMRKDVIFKGQPIAKKEEPRSLINILSGSNA